MKLKTLLEGLPVALCNGDQSVEITNITYDSRSGQDHFVCIDGYNQDAHAYIPMAVQKGAAAITAKARREFAGRCLCIGACI